ncbi:uncharacterized protein LOC125946872 [Dermacentor silvarum]|uniref:uncharacterized protein LOC125946872 n=1 Tax=Dermacentor silvarum TaxID=543639 RepID=UPI00210101BC|nr:uncharacterized protein LOC125946872 [Dermacentor silvarum]
MLLKHAAAGLALLAASLMGPCWAQLKAGCKVDTLQACGEDFVPYGKGTHLEVSGAPFIKNCEIYKEQIECSKKFVRECVEGVPRAAALLGLEAFQDNVEAICTVDSKQYEVYQKAIGCMNSVGAKINACFNSLHSGLEKAVVKAPAKDIVHYACCSYGKLVDCFESVLTPCEEVGGKEFTINLAEQVFGEILSLVCGNYGRGSADCKDLPKLPALGPKDRKFDGYVELVLSLANAIGRRS